LNLLYAIDPWGKNIWKTGALMAKAPSIPFLKSQSLNTNDYVTSRALNRLFQYWGTGE
jgi:hypothetical protein